MTPQVLERWPPIYDADDLRETIRVLVDSGHLEREFFASLTDGPAVCQGDIVALQAAVPVVHEGGEVLLSDDAVGHWLVIGNTCDFSRSIETVPFTQLVPLVDYAAGGPVSAEQVAAMRRYRTSRRFYVPTWPGGNEREKLIAEFTQPVTAHKDAIGSNGRVVARLSRYGWILLHACLVRFLARDDGRFDPA